MTTSWTRRRVLRTTGTGAGVLAGAGVLGLGWRALDQGVLSTGDGPAYAAWGRTAGGSDASALVRSAVLAANAHNSQPWIFRAHDDVLDVYVDEARSTGAVDPLDRERTISLGCAIENVVVAAPAHGLTPTVTLFPDLGDARLVARVALAPAPRSTSRLARAIPRRHTDRGAYDLTRPVVAGDLRVLDRAVEHPETGLVWISTETPMREFGGLTVRATQAFVADEPQAADDYAWYRYDWDQLQRAMDGITFDPSGAGALARATVKVVPTPSIGASGSGWVTATRDRHVATAGAYGLLVAHDRSDPRARVQVGRAYQRLHLTATVLGMSMQPLAQTVERADRERSLDGRPVFTDALAALVPGAEVVLPFRIGRPTGSLLSSPRRPAERVTVGVTPSRTSVPYDPTTA